MCVGRKRRSETAKLLIIIMIIIIDLIINQQIRMIIIKEWMGCHQGCAMETYSVLHC